MPLYKKCFPVGPGGLKCPCCTPIGMTKQDAEKATNRRWRRMAKKEIETQLSEMAAEEIELGAEDDRDAEEYEMSFGSYPDYPEDDYYHEDWGNPNDEIDPDDYDINWWD